MLSRLILPLICAAMLLGADIETKISATQSRIKTGQVRAKELSKRMQELANDISAQSRKLKKLTSEIAALQAKIATLRKNLHIKSSRLKAMEALYRKLKAKEDAVNRKLSSLLAQEIAVDMMEGKGTEAEAYNAFAQSSDDLIYKEVLRTYGKLLRDKFSKTQKEYQKVRKNRELIQKTLQKIGARLDRLKAEQQKLARLKRLQSKTVQNLKKRRRDYKIRLARIHGEQKRLAALLDRLKITKTQKEQSRIKASQTDMRVRKIGSSYQRASVTHYRGKKSIAPLKHYKIVQKFGTFVDPIYKIKIFNDAVKLAPTTRNNMVRNILPGKVVYASKTPVMGYVVIVEHPGGLHTIYANMSKIAPEIRKGSRLKSGYVLGRVSDALTFEVTSNEKHIDPTELFR